MGTMQVSALEPSTILVGGVVQHYIPPIGHPLPHWRWLSQPQEQTFALYSIPNFQ